MTDDTPKTFRAIAAALLPPIAVRAQEDWQAHLQSERAEAERRETHAREQAEHLIRLAIGALTNVPSTEIEIGQADISPHTSSAFSIEALVQGLRFRYIKRVENYNSQSYLYLVQTCRQCEREVLTDIRFMWQLGAALEDAVHPDGICPRPEGETPQITERGRQRRPMTDAEERLIDGLVAVMTERQFPLGE